MIPIILLSRNNSIQLNKTISSILEVTKSPYELHVVDNNSDDPEQISYLCEIEAKGLATVWREERNSWVLGLNNCLSHLERSNPSYYVISDADIIFPTMEDGCWLSEMVRCMDVYPFIGKLGLSLSLENLRGKPHLKHILEHESVYSKESITPEIYLSLVDTTAAIYRPDVYIWPNFRLYPAHGLAIRPYYYTGRHKKLWAYHLGWDEEEYSNSEATERVKINTKIRCLVRYGATIDKASMRSATKITRLFCYFVKPSARLYWGIKLIYHWLIFIYKGRLIRINRIMNRVR